MSADNIERLVRYGKGIAAEFKARRSRIANFVTDHYLTTGSANETILRDFLASLAPTRYGVCEGFICDPTRTGLVSKQCDVLVYNQVDYPLVHSEGQVKVVWPESVEAIIEVKTSLNGDRVTEAIENIRSAKNLRPLAMGAVFAFESLHAETIIKNLREYPQEFPMGFAPEMILLLSERAILKSSTLRTGKHTTYFARAGDDDGVLLTYFLLRLLEQLSSLAGVPKGAMSSAATRVLDQETHEILSDIRIGDMAQ